MQTRGHETIQKAPGTKLLDHVRTVKATVVYQQAVDSGVKGRNMIRTPIPSSHKTWSFDHNFRCKKEDVYITAEGC